MTTALVTGAAGFIGSHLARGLLEGGYDVRGLDNFDTGNRERIDRLRAADGFEFLEADLAASDATERAVEGADLVFHQAAIASVPRSVDRPRETVEANCVGTTNLLDAAAAADVEKVVVASSASVYGSDAPAGVAESYPVDPESPYALSKYWTERLALQFDALHDLPAVALRYFNVFGPGQDPGGEYATVIPAFVEAMAAGQRPVIYGDGRQSRDFVYVDDVVRANRLAAESDVRNATFNVARGERTTIRELVAYVNAVLGTDHEPRYEDARPGDVRHSLADVATAEAELGFSASVDLREGLRRLASAEGREPAPSSADARAD